MFNLFNPNRPIVNSTAHTILLLPIEESCSKCTQGEVVCSFFSVFSGQQE